MAGQLANPAAGGGAGRRVLAGPRAALRRSADLPHTGDGKSAGLHGAHGAHVGDQDQSTAPAGEECARGRPREYSARTC